MQQFKAKLKNVPRNAPLVPCSTNPALNKEEALSVQDKVRTLNNLEVDLLQHKGGQGLRVPVITYAKSQPFLLNTTLKVGLIHFRPQESEYYLVKL